MLETKDLSRRRTRINFGSIVFPHLIIPSASNSRTLQSSAANGQILMFSTHPSLTRQLLPDDSRTISLMNSFIHSPQSTHSDLKSSVRIQAMVTIKKMNYQTADHLMKKQRKFRCLLFSFEAMNFFFLFWLDSIVIFSTFIFRFFFFLKTF